MFLAGVLVLMFGARLVALVRYLFVALDCIWFSSATCGVAFVFGGLVGVGLYLDYGLIVLVI